MTSEEILLSAAFVIIAAAVMYALRARRFDTPKKVRGKLVDLHDAGIQYPGHMAFANKGGEYFHGARVARFANIRDMNSFFEPGNAGHLKLVAEIIPMPDGSVLCVYTNKLSHDDMEDIDEWNRNQHSYFQEKRNKREQEKAEREQEKVRAEAETKRLAEVGRKYEARTKHIRSLDPSTLERKQAEKKLNAGELE